MANVTNIHFQPSKHTPVGEILQHYNGNVILSLGSDATHLAAEDIVKMMHFIVTTNSFITPVVMVDLLAPQYVDIQSKAFYFYQFNNQLKNKNKNKNKNLKSQIKRLSQTQVQQMQMQMQENEIIMSILGEIRQVIDTPPNVAFPNSLMTYIGQFAQRHNLTMLETLNEKQLVAEGLMGLVNVGRGSQHKPNMAILAWNYKASAKPIVLIGKGITYDSGGYSLKSVAGMQTMKHDKTGAMIILGVMGTLARLNIPCPVVAILPLAENALGRDALKPDEIIASHSGLQVEVVNTDAEGRLILMDAISLAQKKYNPRAIIDVATLTGVDVFCGKYGAIYGNNLDLGGLMQRIGQKHGDAFWVMPPLDKFIKDTQNTPMANVKNDGFACSSHTVMAAAFLANFVSPNIPWVHMDLGRSKSLYEAHSHDNEAKTNAFLTLVYTLKMLQQ